MIVVVPTLPDNEPPVSRRRFLGLMGLGASTLLVAGAAGPVERVDHRYTDVSAMLAADPFYVAHHGCSRTWPEMSLYAYTESALRGFGALELSLARTSDGVWFGLHDATLDRTSGITGPQASAMTWAQVRSHRILGRMAADDPAQPSRPYLRWEELIAAFYPSQVIFVDPKYALTFQRELMAKMNALPGIPQDHLVCKDYGVSGDANKSTGWAELAATNGYRSWGYFFAADAAAIPRYQDRWDILGLNYGADESLWASMRAYGKPIIGHIAPNAAAVRAARAKGAVGLVVSSVGALPPGRRRFELAAR